MLTVKELIPQFETAETALDGADAALQAKTDKLTAAKADFATAVSAENDAIGTYNALVDIFTAALIASKREAVVAPTP